jgi:hypothetical protein
MNYDAALAIAERLKADLAPYCTRIEIAGSVRRQRPQVKDVEICAIPLQEPSDLFGAELVTCQGFCAVVNQWEKDIGEPKTCEIQHKDGRWYASDHGRMYATAYGWPVGGWHGLWSSMP